MSVFIVSGASGGVGRGIAVSCGQAGHEVWIAARREVEGRAVAAEVSAAGGIGRFVACDVTDQASVAAAVATATASAGHLDGVVHNATSAWSSLSQPMESVTVDQMQDHLAVGLRGMFHFAKEALPLLAQVGGSFVVLTSEAGFEGKAHLAPYAVVKAAQRGLVRVLAREWGPQGVRINAIAPLALTPAMERAFVSDPTMERRVMARIPLGHLGDPVTEIGSVVRFLLSPDARYVTGQTMMVDGGSCSIS